MDSIPFAPRTAADHFNRWAHNYPKLDKQLSNVIGFSGADSHNHHTKSLNYVSDHTHRHTRSEWNTIETNAQIIELYVASVPLIWLASVPSDHEIFWCPICKFGNSQLCALFGLIQSAGHKWTVLTMSDYYYIHCIVRDGTESIRGSGEKQQVVVYAIICCRRRRCCSCCCCSPCSHTNTHTHKQGSYCNCNRRCYQI